MRVTCEGVTRALLGLQRTEEADLHAPKTTPLLPQSGTSVLTTFLAADPRAWSGTGCHVGGEDAVGVTVEVLVRSVVAHGGGTVCLWRRACSVMLSSIVAELGALAVSWMSVHWTAA